MKLYDFNSETVIADIPTDKELTFDEAIALVGEYDADRAAKGLYDVRINDEWYDINMLELGADEDFDRKALATIDTDSGTMTIYYNGAHDLMTAEKDDLIETLEDEIPGTYARACELIALLYRDPVWNLTWLED